jgi:DNA-binding beta-propeller fold protein YncE
VAYLSALCGSSAYSFTGNALGYFADPATSSVLNYDVMVTTHELGHNFGTNHTDTYGVDICNQVSTPAQRGTIMSYCNQTVSGAMSVIDLRFHKITQDRMRQYLATAPCVVFDCNQNGISDALDIAAATSLDANGNGIPDECEDCNHNGVLDSTDITVGTSLDRNTNGIPDECEPDCNANGFPDEMDIRLGTSQDLHGDTIPDECEPNLNNANGSDYSEIMANMTLDKNRDRILDSVQDCDGDQVTDLVELEGAWDVWAASLLPEGTVREFLAVTGVLMRVGPAGAAPQGQDLIITPDRRVLVTSGTGNSVVEFNRLGQLVRTLVPAGSGGLAAPAGMARTAAGTLLVCSGGTNSVLEYDAASGAFLRTFVPPGSGGLAAPFGLTFGPGGNLLVTSGNNQVLEFNGTTGAFVRVLVSTAGNGGLSTPRGLVFNPLTGNLLVASLDTDQLLEYNGSTGAFVRNWLVTGLPVDGPWCVRVGPDGFIYVSRRNAYADTHLTRARIYIFDPRNGYFVRACVQGLDSGLDLATGFDFMPGNLTDCNRNQMPDNCDILSGRSLDLNGNGVPDECENFCYANCDHSTTAPALNVADFTCFLTKFAAGDPYANCDGSTASPVLNVADFTCFLQKFAAGCP